MELNGRHFPFPELLPAGFGDIGGRTYVKGSLSRALLLKLDQIRLDDDATIVYRKTDGERQTTQIWEALQRIFTSDPATEIDDVEASARAEIQMEAGLSW